MRFYNNTKNLNDYLEYFSIKSINHKIMLNKKNPLINNIISDNYYVNFDNFKLQNNKITIKYYLEIKILYSSLKETKTYFIKNKILGYIEIFIPNKINGEYIENIFLRNGFMVELIVLNPSIIHINNNFISIYLNILAYCDVSPIHSLIYKIQFSKFEENIYSSLANGQDLVQKSFELSKSFKSLKFSPKENYVFCLEQDSFVNCIKKISLENEEILNIYKHSCLKDYDIFDDKNILLLNKTIDENLLILLNTETFEENIFYSLCNIKVKFFKVTKNLIILIFLENDLLYLKLLDKLGNLFYKKQGNFNSAIISPCETFLLLLEENYIKILFLNSKELHPLSKNLINGNIINLKFLNSKEILIHIKDSKKEFLVLFTLANSKKEVLFETNFEILDFSVNLDNSSIYCIVKNFKSNVCKMYIISKSRKIENIFNLSAENISLITRC